MNSGGYLLRGLIKLAEHHNTAGHPDTPIRISKAAFDWMHWHRDDVKQHGFTFGTGSAIFYGQHPVQPITPATGSGRLP